MLARSLSCDVVDRAVAVSGEAHAPLDGSGVADGSADRRFLRSSALVAALTLFSRLTGFVREVLVAGAFGTTPAASALVLAQTVPNLSRSLASEEVAQGTLVPTLSRMSSADRQREGWRLTWLSGLIATGVLTLLFVAVFGLARQLSAAIAPGLDNEALDQTARLLALLAPIIVFNGALGAGSAYLVSERRFGLVGLSAVFSNVPVLVGLFAVPGISVETVALLLVAGYGLQAAFLGLSSVYTRSRIARRTPTRRLDGERLYRDLKAVALVAPPIVLSLCMANLSGIVDMAFSSLVGSGAPAALDKAFRLVVLPYGVFAVAMGTVALPQLAQAAQTPGEFDVELMRVIRFLAVVLIPTAVVAALLADDLVRLAYERGAFDANSRSLTADALVGLSFALPALGMSLAGTRAWISKRRPWPPAAAACLGLVVNAGLDAALIGPLGIAGIGIATAVAHGCVGLVLMLTASEDARAVGRQLVDLTTRVAGLVSLATVVGLVVSAPLTSIPPGLRHVTAVIVGAAVLLGAASHFGVTDYRILLSTLTRQRRHRE